MTTYHVQLPQGLLLEVELGGSPVDFHIRFPGGKKVTFQYRAGPPVSACVHVEEGLFEERIADRTRVCAWQTTEAGIEYSDPGSVEM